jgi:hypothetical protein
MSRPAVEFEEQQRMIAALIPAVHQTLYSPPTISNNFFRALTHVVHNVGGQPDVPIVYQDLPELEWEVRTYVTCECLAWRGAWNAEIRRRAENDLGETLYYGLPYYGRWITVAAKILIDRGLISLEEFERKMDEVRQRLVRGRLGVMA